MSVTYSRSVVFFGYSSFLHQYNWPPYITEVLLKVALNTITLIICNQCLSPLTLWVWIPLKRDVFDTTLVDEVCQWLTAGRWFSPGAPDSSTNKTDCHNITEILLNVAISTINLTLNVCTKVFMQLQLLN